jgi:hypothetical protein
VIHREGIGGGRGQTESQDFINNIPHLDIWVEGKESVDSDGI